MPEPRTLFSVAALSGRATARRAVPPRSQSGAPPPPAASSSLWTTARRLLPRAAVVTAVLILAFTAGLAVFRSQYADRVYPGVVVGSQPLGGLSQADARAALAHRAQSLENGTVLFTFQGKTWTPTLAQLGVTIDVNRSLAAAMAVGREADAWDRLRATSSLLRHDDRLPLVLNWNQGTLAHWFDTVDQSLGQPPHDAYLTIQGTTVTVVPEVNGTIINRAQATAVIQRAITTLTPVSAPLPTVARVATVRAGDLIPLQHQAQAALAKPVQLSFEGQSWTLQPADLGKFLRQTSDPTKRGAAAIGLTVDQQALGAWLNNLLAKPINRAPVNAKVAWSDDQQGVVALSASQDGDTLKPLTLAQDVAASLLGDHHAVQVPVTITKPAVDSHNLAALGITTKLAVGDSDYEGSDDGRAHNIEVGIQILNGTLIPPHGTFSFNGAVGAITPQKGFTTSQVIQGDEIGRDVGGGICQVSTTVYRAAFKAGMPIVELYPHSYRLSFYEQDGWQPGIDASILQEGDDPSKWADFKFANPSDHWMLLEAYTNNDRAYVILYGADLGYQVTISNSVETGTTPPDPPQERVDPSLPPGTMEQVNSPRTGSDWVVTRTVKDRNGNIIEQKDFESDYQSSGEIWVVSPDMKGKSPAAQGN